MPVVFVDATFVDGVKRKPIAANLGASKRSATISFIVIYVVSY